MLKASIIISALVLPMAVTASADTIFKSRRVADNAVEAAPVVRYHAPVKATAPATDPDATVKASFTYKGGGSQAPVWTDNFDSGLGNWTIENTSYVTWTTKSKGFSAIDPDDKGSMFVEGPYQAYRRECSSAVSQYVEIPANAEFHAYVGFSQNYDDMCRLSLTVSADGFETSEEIWNSSWETGEKPWRWHKVDVALDAYAGKKVQFCFTYGPGSADSFNTGGYMGDFSIDGVSVSGVSVADNVALTTGEVLQLVDLSSGDVASWEWSFPGGVPSSSTEQAPAVYYTADGTYDISLTVADAAGRRSTMTCPGYVTVTGTAPVAHIVPPASFRNASNGRYLVAPLAPVTFTDGSEGFPTSRAWTFSGVNPEPYAAEVSSEEAPVVSYSYLHDQTAELEVENIHGRSSDQVDLSVEYSAMATNVRTGEYATNFDMGDWGLFPGSNTQKITAYAEKFSRPSRPVMIDGVYVYFTHAEAEEVADQIANVGVHLYTCKDGKPDKRLDSFWWSVFELDLPAAGSTDLVGTAFPFTECPIVDDEFFIVVDGIPAKTETTNVAFAMAPFRGEGNTSYMLKNGEWVDVSTYFPAGKNHTSFMIYPSVSHSVMAPLTNAEGSMAVGSNAGTVKFQIFSYMGYKTPVEIDADWCRLVSEPNGYTVDDLEFEFDALPADKLSRTANITLTDGASTLPLVLTQSKTQGVESITATVDGPVDVYSLQGVELRHAVDPAEALEGLPAGLYIVSGPAGTTKVVIP